MFEVNENEGMGFGGGYKDRYEVVKRELGIVYGGICLGELKGKEWEGWDGVGMSIGFEKEWFGMGEVS